MPFDLWAGVVYWPPFATGLVLGAGAADYLRASIEPPNVDIFAGFDRQYPPLLQLSQPYRVEVTSPSTQIPARYNTQTTLGIEAAPITIRKQSGGVEFTLTSD